MYNLLKVEMYKLKYSKELLICIIGLFVLGAINIYYGGVLNGREALTAHLAVSSGNSLAEFSILVGEYDSQTVQLPGHQRFVLTHEGF